MKRLTKVRIFTWNTIGNPLPSRATRHPKRAADLTRMTKSQLGSTVSRILVRQGATTLADIPAAVSDLDSLTRHLTAFDCFHDLLHAKGGYRPSLRCISGCPFGKNIPELTRLADGYDAAQAQRGDPRRAFRS